MLKFKGHNSRELHGIWLVIELGQGIKPTNIATNDDPLKNIFKKECTILFGQLPLKIDDPLKKNQLQSGHGLFWQIWLIQGP